jgi:hypothetical protein
VAHRLVAEPEPGGRQLIFRKLAVPLIYSALAL